MESPSSIESAATVVETNRMTHSSSYVGGIVGGSSNRSSRDSNKTHHVIQSSSSPTSSEQSVPIPVNSQIKKRIQKRIQESNSAAKEIWFIHKVVLVSHVQKWRQRAIFESNISPISPVRQNCECIWPYLFPLINLKSPLNLARMIIGIDVFTGRGDYP